jgi:hypothetical protein
LNCSTTPQKNTSVDLLPLLLQREGFPVGVAITDPPLGTEVGIDCLQKGTLVDPLPLLLQTEGFPVDVINLPLGTTGVGIDTGNGKEGPPPESIGVLEEVKVRRGPSGAIITAFPPQGTLRSPPLLIKPH